MQPSARSRSAYVRANSLRCSDPISSSPSNRTRTFSGSGPTVAVYASIACRRAMRLPLLSDVPRPNRRPSRTVGSNGGVVPSPSGSGGCTAWWSEKRRVRGPPPERVGRLHVVVVVDEQRARAAPLLTDDRRRTAAHALRRRGEAG